MSNCGENKNPLQRGGTSQKERLLDALKPSYVSVDEHEYQDWIVFANEFAGFLNYFDADNKATETWKSFFTSDISSQLGSVAIQNVHLYREEIKKRFDFLKKDDNRNDIAGLERNLNELFSAALTLSKAFDYYYKKLPVSVTLKNTLLNLIQTKLAPALNRLISYYKEANTLNYLTVDSFNGWNILNAEVKDAGTILSEGLSINWIVGTATNWPDYINGISGDLHLFETALADDATLTNDQKEYLRIQHAANHNLFSSIFDQYLFAFTKITGDASVELEKTLTDWDSHQPHYALFLAFLKLFRYAQQQVNTITKRHLDFYYKEVLKLKPKEAQPNHAHVLVDLAKQVDSYLLKKGTELKAGKDSIGADVIYSLDGDSTFNKAKVVSLRSVYKASTEDSIKDYSVSSTPIIQNNVGRLFASPIANSEDGLGKELTGAAKEWHPFVHKEFSEGNLTSISMPLADIGFAIASHYLYLTEGERKVYIKLVTSANSLLTGKHIGCYLTTAKGWLKVTSPVIGTTTLTGTSTSAALISFTLTGDLPAIENYNAAVHGGTFNCELPVLKVFLSQQDLTQYEYDALKDMAITSAEVRIEVGMDSGYNQKGLKKLLLSNDNGPLDASKPFMPFGSQPKTDSTFVIGNRELFSKKHSQINLNIEWAALPGQTDIKFDTTSSAELPNVDGRFFTGKVWTNTTDPITSGTVISSLNNISILDQASKALSLFSSTQLLPDKNTIPYADEYLPFSSSSSKGFLQLRLKSDFGHKSYLETLTAYLISQSKTPAGTTPSKPTEPYTPLMQSLYISYSAYQTTDLTSISAAAFNEREIRFFHLYPFGEAEQHKYLNSINSNTDPVYLFPQFRHWGKDENNITVPIYHCGEFYIGIENLEANDAVNILFQVLEGSTNPKVSKPPNHIKWSYLANNFWKDFTDQQISDATLGLLQSGIISFALPPGATTNNTLLPADMIWIKAGIETSAEAISKLLSVDAQAAISTFQPNKNADDFLDHALPARTITKLKRPDAAIKKIAQPFNSFGGRPKENEDHFYIRVSERLRHKSRAITIWDYEHLVLEAFPEIYKVKCLNHTAVCTSGGKEYTNEVQPGHVLVITIPSLKNRNEADPLKPFTNQDTLTKIENFLKEKVSCFVTLKTRQPLFEEVGISFSLKLYEEYRDFTLYANMLRQEITQFLTPWAYDSNADIQFGGKIYKSSLINFIEERYYVDYITNVTLSHKIDTVTTQDPLMEEITASTARSILVSMPASKHNINPIIEKPSVSELECVSLTGTVATADCGCNH